MVNRIFKLDKRLFRSVAFAVMLSQLWLPQSALAESSQQRELRVAVATPPPKVNAVAWALMEQNSRWVVAGNNSRQPLPPASITKLMMNYILYSQLSNGQLKNEELVPISERAWRAEGSRMFADVNDKIALGHLLKSTVIQSGNDAAIALAEYISGSEEGFARLMNQTAGDLGLSDSSFLNSTGLPAPGHVMSANDIAALSARIISDFPEKYKWYAIKQYTHNNITQYNRNKLIWKDASIDGLKTGFTDEAGYCLVGSAERDGQRWIAVVLGAKSVDEREAAVQSLLEYGFSQYKAVRLLDQQGGINQARVFGGVSDEVRLRVSDVADVVVPAGRVQDIKTSFQVSPYYQAPIAEGVPMGYARLSLDGKTLKDIPLLAMSRIERGSWWKRMTDSIKLRIAEFTGGEP